MTLNDTDRRALLNGYARWGDLIRFLAPESAHEIAAICFRESAWDTKAERFERGFWDKYLEDNREWRKRMDKRGWQEHKAATSWGLMQIMYVTAWERGYRGNPDDLLKPELSLLYGAKHLDWLWLKYNDVIPAIAAYNAGCPRYNLDGTYVNQDYVDYVLAGVALLTSHGTE